MFIDAHVNHNKFGAGVITDLEINPVKHINSLLTVKFDSGEIKKFPMKAFRDEKFFTTDDPEIVPYVLEHETEEDKPKERKIIKYVEKPENEF